MQHLPGLIIRTSLLISTLALCGCGDRDLYPNYGYPNNGQWPQNNTNTTNTAPVANAGGDMIVTTGAFAPLFGGNSYDEESDPLTFRWSFLSRPEGSAAALSDETAVNPTFTADKAGIYIIQLVVNDGQADSAADTITVTAETVSSNWAPSAYAGPDQYVLAGSLVALDGSGSFDMNGDPLTYRWSFFSKPQGSTAALSDAAAVGPTFTADKDGSYILQLVVNDGQADSYASTATILAITIEPAHVPDTGQTTDYTATFGEDSDYAINTPSYTDNGDSTVTDTVTGLMWQQQDDGTAMDWNSAAAYCGDLALAGYTDWRLPDNKELISIVNYGASGPAIDSVYFPNTQSTSYWTSTAYIANDAILGQGVVFDDGSNSNPPTSHSLGTYNVRCVRDGQDWIVFTDNGDGTVTDDITTLIWQQADDNTVRTWEAALSYCEGLLLAGYSDWRLPNVKELLSIVDYGYFFPAVDLAIFPNTVATRYWSSTSRDSFPNTAWGVNFGVGIVDALNKPHSFYARCVRVGQ